VSNRKSKDAAKRREAKKRRKAIKRKAQASTVTLRNIQMDYPTEYVSANKLSEVILEYAEPLTNVADGSELEERAIRMSVTLWNASLLPKQKALETMEPALDDMAQGDQLLKSEFYLMFELMYKRKQSLFQNDKRFIVDYTLEENDGGFYLQVASTPFESKETPALE
jgi:hypothetical protein